MVFKRKTTVLNCSILLRNDLLPLESQLCIFILLGLFWLTHFWLDWWMNIAMLLIELWAWAEMVLDHHRSSMMRCPLKDADSVNPRGGVGHRRLWSMSLLLIFCHIMIILYLCCNKLSLLDIILKAPRLVFILILYLSNSTKQKILGRQCYLLKSSAVNFHCEAILHGWHCIAYMQYIALHSSKLHCFRMFLPIAALPSATFHCIARAVLHYICP